MIGRSNKRFYLVGEKVIGFCPAICLLLIRHPIRAAIGRARYSIKKRSRFLPAIQFGGLPRPLQVCPLLG